MAGTGFAFPVASEDAEGLVEQFHKYLGDTCVGADFVDVQPEGDAYRRDRAPVSL